MHARERHFMHNSIAFLAKAVVFSFAGLPTLLFPLQFSAPQNCPLGNAQWAVLDGDLQAGVSMKAF